MAVLVLLSVILVRNLKVENPGKKQLALESIITTFNNLFSDVMGEKGKAYIPYLITVILYIGMANIAGIFGFKEKEFFQIEEYKKENIKIDGENM